MANLRGPATDIFAKKRNNSPDFFNRAQLACRRRGPAKRKCSRRARQTPTVPNTLLSAAGCVTVTPFRATKSNSRATLPFGFLAFGPGRRSRKGLPCRIACASRGLLQIALFSIPVMDQVEATRALTLSRKRRSVFPFSVPERFD